MIPAIAIAAYSGTGKTTLIERLPALRSRGLRVAVVKHDGHRFDIDHEGKDSWRFTQAGAQVCVISSAEKNRPDRAAIPFSPPGIIPGAGCRSHIGGGL